MTTDIPAASTYSTTALKPSLMLSGGSNGIDIAILMAILTLSTFPLLLYRPPLFALLKRHCNNNAKLLAI